jgi:hypothetical protein
MRALADAEHKDLWLSMAERWGYLAWKEAGGVVTHITQQSREPLASTATPPPQSL